MVKWIDSLNESLIRATEWAGKNFKALAVVLTLLLVVGAVWAGIHHSNQSKAGEALIAYAPIERDFLAWKTPEEPKVKEQKAKDKQAKEEQKASTNPSDEMSNKIDPGSLFTRMLDYIKTEGDVPANELMVLMASEVAAHLGPDKEAELLETARKVFKNGSNLMDGLVLIKKGDLFANQGQCDQALSQWKEVLSNNRLVYLHDVTRLKSGLCLEKMSQFKDAEMNYDQVIQGAAAEKNTPKAIQMARQNQWAVKEAQKLKRALKWSQKQPSS